MHAEYNEVRKLFMFHTDGRRKMSISEKYIGQTKDYRKRTYVPICMLKISKGARNSHPDEPAPTYGDYK